MAHGVNHLLRRDQLSLQQMLSHSFPACVYIQLTVHVCVCVCVVYDDELREEEILHTQSGNVFLHAHAHAHTHTPSTSL